MRQLMLTALFACVSAAPSILAPFPYALPVAFNGNAYFLSTPTISPGDIEAAALDAQVKFADQARYFSDEAKDIAEQAVEKQNQEVLNANDFAKEKAEEALWAAEEKKYQALNEAQVAEARLAGSIASTVASKIVSTEAKAEIKSEASEAKSEEKLEIKSDTPEVKPEEQTEIKSEVMEVKSGENWEIKAVKVEKPAELMSAEAMKEDTVEIKAVAPDTTNLEETLTALKSALASTAFAPGFNYQPYIAPEVLNANDFTKEKAEEALWPAEEKKYQALNEAQVAEARLAGSIASTVASEIVSTEVKTEIKSEASEGKSEEKLEIESDTTEAKPEEQTEIKSEVMEVKSGENSEVKAVEVEKPAELMPAEAMKEDTVEIKAVAPDTTNLEETLTALKSALAPTDFAPGFNYQPYVAPEVLNANDFAKEKAEEALWAAEETKYQALNEAQVAEARLAGSIASTVASEIVSTEAKAEIKSEASEAKSEEKLEIKSDTTQAKPEEQTEIKSEVMEVKSGENSEIQAAEVDKPAELMPAEAMKEDTVEIKAVAPDTTKLEETLTALKSALAPIAIAPAFNYQPYVAPISYSQYPAYSSYPYQYIPAFPYQQL